MFGWLKKIADNTRLKNAQGISRSALSLIGKDLAQLNGTYPGLGDVLLGYVVDDDPASEQAVLKLRGLADAAEAMKLASMYYPFRYGYKPCKTRREFFQRMPTRDGGVLYRLAQVYHAAWSAQSSKRLHWPHLGSELEWLEILFREATTSEYGADDDQPAWRAADFEAMLACGTHPADSLARLVLFAEPLYGYSYSASGEFDSIAGLGDYLARHESVIVEALQHPKAQHRVHVLSLLGHYRVPFSPALLETLARLAVGSAKTVREAAENNLKPYAGHAALLERIRHLASQGSNTERLYSIGLLVRLQGEQTEPFLSERLARESGKKIRAELEKYLHIQKDIEKLEDAPRAYEDGLQIPPARTFSETVTLSTAAEQAFYALIEQYNAAAISAHAQFWDRLDKRWRRGKRDIAAPLKRAQAAAIWKGLLSAQPCREGKQVAGDLAFVHILYQKLGEFVQQQELGPVAIIRLGFLTNLVGSDKGKGNGNEYRRYRCDENFVDWLSTYIRSKDPNLSLLDLAAAFTAAGLSEKWVQRLYLDWGWQSRFNPLELEDAAIWPFFLNYPVGLEEALGLRSWPAHMRDYFQADYKKRAYQILASFPRPPHQFAAVLWDAALGPGKTERPLAQACLANYPGKEALIIGALGDGKKDVRASAAAWLAELGATQAVQPLQAALKKEKHDEAKAAMMEALEALGVDIDRFLNRRQLLQEAEEGLKKALPKDLAWFPFEQLPGVRWEKSGQTVEKSILKWFVVQSCKLKNPEPGPLLRRYFGLMHTGERRVFGAYVLDAWIAQDTLPKYRHDEAAALAERELARMRQWARQNPQWYPDFNEEQARKAALNRYLNECSGSANASKGILAIAGAACGPEIVPAVERYLKQWYGHRMAQCKALLAMLSWVDHPLAIQLILSIATRFRTKGIQKEAGKYADRIAERKGWSRDEMADRTIPTAGFDADGEQVIDYGMRAFSAVLQTDFSIELRNPDGKPVKNLPEANRSEDADEVKALKKAFSASKKELKQVLKLQRERLYEAMCVQREWRYEDWDLFLNRHPIVGRYCQRLVWLAVSGGGGDGDAVVTSFRPLPDRSLSDVDDEAVALAADDRIKLAHGVLVPAVLAGRWREHLQDYEVEPLFEQFDKSAFRLDEIGGDKTEILQFQGHLVNSFRLRSRVDKLGYTRGQAEDGGWFYTYHKIFPSLELQAVIEFTGNVLPEEERTVALLRLYFTRLKDGHDDDYAYAHRPLKLAHLPEVLLAECWNDLRMMAADGPGYDAQWEKKSAY